MTGEQMESQIFIGPTYYMRLKHMVKDKINYRARGPRTVLTRQTVQGRANDGGLRIGEMERDGLISHGITNFINESMLVRGDEYYMAVCNKTGTIAVYNESKNLFLSPMADGPIKFSGTLQEDMNIQNLSRYGRDFSVVRVPYSLKLLYQELQTMNVQMRLITEDNIDQLTTLGYSDNIQKLTKNEKITPLQVAEKTNSVLRGNRVGDMDISKIYKYEGDEEYDKPYYKDMALVLPPSMAEDKEKTGPAQPFGTTPPTPKTPEDGYDTYVPGKDDDFNFDDEPYQYDPLYKPSELPPGTPVSPNYLPSPPIGLPQTPPLGPVSPAGPPGLPQTPPMPPLSPNYLPTTPPMPPVSPNYLPTTPPLGMPQTPPMPPVSPSYAAVSPVGPPMTPPQIQLTAPADPNLGKGITELNIKNPEKNVKFDMVKKDENKKGGGDSNTKTLLFSLDKVDKDDDTEK